MRVSFDTVAFIGTVHWSCVQSYDDSALQAERPRVLGRITQERLQECVADVLRPAPADRPEVIDERAVGPSRFLLRDDAGRAERPLVAADEVGARGNHDRRTDAPDDAAGIRFRWDEKEFAGDIVDTALTAVADEWDVLIDDRHDHA